MKILVTGGTVFASRFTSEYFAAEGNEVFVLNRGTRPQSDGVTHIKADRHALGDSLKSHSFDLVIDVCAYNEADIRDLLDGLGEFGGYVMISSSAVYPETLPQPFAEDAQTGANSIWGAYGSDKLAAEKALLERVPQAYILRPPYLCGRMNNLYREAFVFECAEKALPFYLPKDGGLQLQFLDIEDLCRFIKILIEKKPERRIFNVGNPETVTAHDWVKRCYAVLERRCVFVYVDGAIPQRSYFPFRDYEYRLDVSAMTELMPTLKPLDESLRQSYEWFAENREQVIGKPLLGYIAENL